MSMPATPEAEYRTEFEKRKPALGWTEREFSQIESRYAVLAPVGQRSMFSSMRETMLRMLIPTSGASDVPGLVAILRAELKSGVPAPTPKWYTFSEVRTLVHYTSIFI
jgi:hypothetical protein